jgi:hypothetical protein
VDVEDAERARQVQPEESKLGVIWWAMIFAIVAYAAIGLVVAPRGTFEFEDRELRYWLLMFLSVAGGLHMLTALLLRQILASLSSGRYLVYCILRWSLMEGIGIYGLVCAFLGMDAWIHSIFYVVAAALLINAQPGGHDRAIFVGQFE